MAETVILDKVLDGANVWIQDAPTNVRVEVAWHRESGDRRARTVEPARTLWEVNPNGSDGALKTPFDVALLPPSPTLADVFRLVRDRYILPSM